MKEEAICLIQSLLLKSYVLKRPKIQFYHRVRSREAKWTHAGLRFQTGVKASSVHIKFHFGCISKRPDMFISGSVYKIFYYEKWNFISVKTTDMKSIPAVSFKRTCALNAIFNESTLIYFVSGKFCSHENLMPIWNFISVKMTDMKSIPFWVLFRFNSCEHK